MTRGFATVAALALLLSGCESMTTSIGKKIDYKSATTAPPLDIPPELSAPQYDDRFTVATASGMAARDATKPAAADQIAPREVAGARIERAGTERWIVARTTPENALALLRQFWADQGFVVAYDQPAIGVIETDWAENRADIPDNFLRRALGRVGDFLYNTYKRDKFRTRVERGSEPGTVEIYLSHRGMEQLPTTTTGGSPAAFAWAVLPPNPGLESEFLTRLLIRFGAKEPQAREAVQASTAPATETAAAPGRPAAARADAARLETTSDGVTRLVVDDSFDRAWRRVGLTLDRIGFTVVDRDRSNGFYFVRYADPEAERKDPGFLSKLAFWRDSREKPEQYRIVVTESGSTSVVVVQNPQGAPDATPTAGRILALLRDQLK